VIAFAELGDEFAVSPIPPRHPAKKATIANVMNHISGLVILLNPFI
jgi:hypothetical protein